MKAIKIGIIGMGYVGKAVEASYVDNPYIQLIRVDLDTSKGYHGTYEQLQDAEAVFVCVSSPSKYDGSCDSTPLENVLSKLQNINSVIISKVTAPPDVYNRLQAQFKNLVHAPEFLTAANSINDYLNGKFLILGGTVPAYLNEAARIIKLGQPNIEITYKCSISEASMAKYIINSFLATKVVFMNEMENLCRKGGQDWDTIRQLISLDNKRIGTSHTQVPGPDGNYGFGGACFPKDTAALLKYAEQQECSLEVLDTAVKKNLILRLT